MEKLKIATKKLLRKVGGLALRHASPGVGRESQLLLMLEYQRKRVTGEPLPHLNDIEFRAYSQNGEDGILLYVFSLIGTTAKTAVEICAGNGTECNTANLFVNHGWTGLLVDGDIGNVTRGTEFYRSHPDTFTYPPRFIHAWVDAQNINSLISDNGYTGEVDLLSLDIDGVDYWIWLALDVIRPRVVVAEVQVIWGDERSVTVPYQPDFRTEFVGGFGAYSGASLPAFVKLARMKGYRLIGTQRYGFNAFFMRNDLGADVFPEVTATECLRHPFVKWAQATLLPSVKDREWIEV